MPTDEKLSQKTAIVLSPSMLQDIDDWRFRHRIGSRADAIRQILEAGLAVKQKEEKQDAATAKPSPKST